MVNQKKIPNTQQEVSEKTNLEMELAKITMELDNTTPSKNETISAMNDASLMPLERTMRQPFLSADENTVVKEDGVEQKPFGRPKKEAALGRKAFTTSLAPSLSHKLKQKALERGITTADLLDQILKEQLDNY